MKIQAPNSNNFREILLKKFEICKGLLLRNHLIEYAQKFAALSAGTKTYLLWFFGGKMSVSCEKI